ncbi:MAG: carbohydrate-binding domain-containing protein [Muribaculaceae bacterium]|nr:carbohydrate-binding domain-containing protein [Muribaculaceae bacterium]
MKKLSLVLAFTIAACVSWAQQTLWVSMGQIKYAFESQQVGLMPFSAGGDTLTIQGKAFAIADIDSLYITSEIVDGNTVNIEYDNDKATAIIAGNIASQLTPTIDGAHVSMVQDTLMMQEVFYTLSGTSADGSFFQSGNYKATFILNGLTLTNTKGAAIVIDDGKRIEIQVADGTTNTLEDCEKGTQSACFVVEGHSEFKGGGNLVITGNTKHGFKSDEYMELKKSFVGTINVKKAVGDGVSVNQFLEVKSGNIIVDQCGNDGIQVDCKKDSTKTNNGQFIMTGGYIRVNATEDSGKGIKVEKDITISDGTIETTADDNALHSKTNLTITGGNIYAYSVAAHGVNAGEITHIAGGNVVAYAPSTVGYSIRGAMALYISGGNIAGVGALVSTPLECDTITVQPVLTYTGTVAKTNFSLSDADGNHVMAFTQGRSYSSSKKHTLFFSTPTFIEGATYTLYSGSTLDTEKENWHGLYLQPEAVTDSGTSLATGTAQAPFVRMQ